MSQGHDGHMEDGRFGVTRVSCRCQVCYKGFIRSGAEALIPLNSIPNHQINKIISTILTNRIDEYYPKTYQEWCILKLHICDECWQKSMSKKIAKQKKKMEQLQQMEFDPVEDVKEENIDSEDDIDGIYERYNKIKDLIREGSYIRKHT